MRGFAGLLSILTIGLVPAPAAAQYYPGYGAPMPFPGPIPSGPTPGLPYGYGPGRQLAINQCANAAQARLDAVGGGRVLGISDARPRPDGGMAVQGVATSAPTYGYGYGYNGGPPVTLTWACRTDVRGFIRDLSVGRTAQTDDYTAAPWTDDYSRFGYRRY